MLFDGIDTTSALNEKRIHVVDVLWAVIVFLIFAHFVFCTECSCVKRCHMESTECHSGIH